MVKEPKEQFRLLREQIHFWNEAIENARACMTHARLVKNKNVRELKKLEKKYSE